MGRAAKGPLDREHFSLKPDEKIAATIRVQSKKSGTGPTAVDQTWDKNLHIVFATQSGIVKKSNLSNYANVRRGGIIAIQIEEGDRLIDAKLTNGNNENRPHHEERNELAFSSKNNCGIRVATPSASGEFARRKASYRSHANRGSRRHVARRR